MGFPYTTHANFEGGTTEHFDAEVDTGSRLAVVHYKELLRNPHTLAPYRGAYVLDIDLGLSTNDAYLQETGSWDLTAGTDEIHVRLRFALSRDIVMADTNEFALLQFWSATSTVEAGLYVNYTTANGYRLGIGEASASQFKSITPGVWYEVELDFDPAGASASELNWYLDGKAGTAVTGFTSADITSAVVGVIGQDAGTTQGHVEIDEVIAETGSGNRIYHTADRFPETLHIEKSTHLFVGFGIIDMLALNSGGETDNVATLYDTDEADSNTHAPKAIIQNISANESPVESATFPVRVTRGAYLSLSGTNPRATVLLRHAVGYHSDGNIRHHALRG